MLNQIPRVVFEFSVCFEIIKVKSHLFYFLFCNLSFPKRLAHRMNEWWDEVYIGFFVEGGFCVTWFHIYSKTNDNYITCKLLSKCPLINWMNEHFSIGKLMKIHHPFWSLFRINHKCPYLYQFQLFYYQGQS